MSKTSVPVNSNLSNLQASLNQEVDSLEQGTTDDPIVPFSQAPEKGKGEDVPTETSAMVGKAMTEDAKRTKEAFDKEPRVMISIPLYPGEKPGEAMEFAAVNGYSFYMKKGVMISLPQSVASSIMNHYNIQQGETEKGKSMLLSRDAAAEQALR